MKKTGGRANMTIYKAYLKQEVARIAKKSRVQDLKAEGYRVAKGSVTGYHVFCKSVELDYLALATRAQAWDALLLAIYG